MKSVAQVTWMVLATVGDSLTKELMLTGRGGRLGSGVGLLVGIGFCGEGIGLKFQWKVKSFSLV